MCYPPKSAAGAAVRPAPGPHRPASLFTTKAAISAALESREAARHAAPYAAYAAAPLPVSPQNSVETDWSSPTLNDSFDMPAALDTAAQPLPHEFLAAFHSSFPGFYDEKNVAAINHALFENVGLFSPELLDAASPFLHPPAYPPLVDAEPAQPPAAPFFPAIPAYPAASAKYEPAVKYEFDYPATAPPASADPATLPAYPTLTLKRSADLTSADGASTLSDSEEADASDEDYRPRAKKARSDGASASGKKQRARPAQADDILLKTDPETLSRLLVPVRKRRQPKPLDPNLPIEVVEKRIKNTEAARRSRLRKTLKMDQLEQRVTELEAERGELVRRLEEAERERDEWRQRCAQVAWKR
ncbi:hypothetical protein DFJ74DRAFT_690724 [Hyaloraphidium curvatum]|nr:hypothetical protein DFJ74DRAFT_690724 [Hyaloraphidium curvatum]